MPVQADPTTWRSAPYSNRAWLWLHSPQIVFQAQVNQASFAYPVSSVTYDSVTVGTISAVRDGMTLLLGTAPGLDDLGRQRVRGVLTATTIPIGWSSAGTHDGEVLLADNAYITILDEYRVWAKIPRILESGQSFKDFNKPLGVNGVNLVPIANAGPPVCEYLNAGQTSVTVTLDASASLATTPSVALTGYRWEIPGQADVLTATAVVTFTEGFRYVHLTVIDALNQRHTTHLPVLVVRADSAGLIKDFEITRTLQADGQRCTLTIYEPIPLSTYPDGTMVLYWEEERYRGVAARLTGARRNVKFYGWISTNADRIAVDEATMTRDNGVTLECVDVAGRLAALPGFPQILEKKAAPTTWQHIKYTNINLFVHYILYWHSTALDVTDLFFSAQAALYPFPVLDSDGASLYQQADNRARAIAHRLTCDSTGTLRVVGDPQEQLTTDRTTVVIVALNASDYREIGYTRQRPPRVHWLEGAAIVANSMDAELAAVQPVFSIAPGVAPGQGTGAGNKNYQLVRSQSELNARTGHQYARANARYSPLRIELTRVGDAGIEPALCEWVTLSIPATVAAQRGDQMPGRRWLPIEVSYARDNTTASQNVSMTLEAEVIGTPGQTVIPDTLIWPPYEVPELTIYPIPEWGMGLGVPEEPIDELQEETGVPQADIGVALTWNDAGEMALTDTFLLEEVQWFNVRANAVGAVVDACGSYDSDNTLYIIRILTVDAMTGRIYRREVLNETTWTLESTFTFTGVNPRTTEARLRCNSDSTLTAAAWLAQDAIRCVRKGAGVWGSAVIVGAATVSPDTSVNDKALGLHVDGTTVLCGGKNASNIYHLYKASGEAGVFAALGGGGLFDAPVAAVHTGPGNYAYAGSWSADYTIVPRAMSFYSSGRQIAATLLASNPAGGLAAGSMDNTMYLSGPLTSLPAGAYLRGRWDFDPFASPTKSVSAVLRFQNRHTSPPGGSPKTLSWSGIVKTTEGGTYTSGGSETISPTFNPPSGGVYVVEWIPSTPILSGIDIEGETLLSVQIEVSVAEASPASSSFWIMAVDASLEWDDFVPDKNRLWRIADYNGIPAWTNILNAAGDAPYHPYGLSANRLRSQTLTLAGGHNGDFTYTGNITRRQTLLQSLTRGTSWTAYASGYDWVQGAADVYVAGGENTLTLLTPTLLQSHNRLGNFAEVCGTVGKMRGCLLAILPGS